jgi:hypothetical protein
MQMKLLGITNVDFDEKDQSLIKVSVSDRYWKKWADKGTVHQLFVGFKKAYDSVRRKVLYSFSLTFECPGN